MSSAIELEVPCLPRSARLQRAHNPHILSPIWLAYLRLNKTPSVAALTAETVHEREVVSTRPQGRKPGTETQGPKPKAEGISIPGAFGSQPQVLVLLPTLNTKYQYVYIFSSIS